MTGRAHSDQDIFSNKYLPGICNALMGGNAMSEPNSGSDTFSLSATAIKQCSRYILNGSKSSLPMAPIADLPVVFAAVDKTRGPDAISAFLLEKNSPGMNVAGKLEKMGVRTSPMAEENLLGKEDSGAFSVYAVHGWGTRLQPRQRGRVDVMIVGNVHPLCERAQTTRPVRCARAFENFAKDRRTSHHASRLRSARKNRSA